MDLVEVKLLDLPLPNQNATKLLHLVNNDQSKDVHQQQLQVLLNKDKLPQQN